MGLFVKKKTIFLLCVVMLICCTSFAGETLFHQARQLQRSGNYDKSINLFIEFLTQNIDDNNLKDDEITLYSEAIMQLMNTFQSKGEPEECVATLKSVYSASPVIQKYCQRDYYSVLGYALSRTENMEEAEKTMLNVFTLPMHNPTPQSYFRDYAYAAAVFYGNPDYQDEVINWCKEALQQAEFCDNTSGAQWVKSMLGSLYKRNGHLNEALELFQQSKAEAEASADDLGVLNSLNSLIDLFLYWDIPEYANIYATEALAIERGMTEKNPMISAQAYINKARALYQLREVDSLANYIGEARKLCGSMPYNSGMVDVDLISGSYLVDKGGDSFTIGIQQLSEVAKQGTHVNRARAYHQLAQAYLRGNDDDKAQVMLDSLYTLVAQSDNPIYIKLDYEPIISYYIATNNATRAKQFVELMLREREAFKAKRLNFNLVESIVDLHTQQKSQELRIVKLQQTNQRLWFLVAITLALVVIAAVVLRLYRQKRKFRLQISRANERFDLLVKELNESNVEKERITQEIQEFLMENDNRQELETLTPFILKKSGEAKFRQCFELLYPLFLYRLRERVPSITRREELLSMLIVLKQGTKEISELLAIAPRSVLMLRHRFRQKIGIDSEYSLENFIEDTLDNRTSLGETSDTMAEHTEGNA